MKGRYDISISNSEISDSQSKSGFAVPQGCLQFVIVVFPDHTHLLFFMYLSAIFSTTQIFALLDSGSTINLTDYLSTKRYMSIIVMSY